MQTMEHAKQVTILKELMRQLDEKVNVDAGVMYKNPTSVYTCREIAGKEREVLFRNHPQLIGLSGDLPEPNSFIAVDDFGVPVLATRDEDGRFRAFLNACRHRGVRVAHDDRGTSRRFVCPFHNWTYSSGGNLVGIPQQEHFGAVDKSCRGLIELPTAEKYGLLWVHPKVDGHIDVDALLGGLAPEIDSWKFGEDLIFQGESVIEKRLNWKLANDTFGETYHFLKLHKDTLGQIFHGDVLHYEEFGRNHRFVIATRGIDLMRDQPEESWDMLQGTSPLYFLFPNIQFSFGSGSVNLIKIYPHPDDPSRSLTRVSHYLTSEAIALAGAGSDVQKVTAENVYDRDGFDRQYSEPVVFDISALFETFDSTIEKEDYLMGETTQRAADNGTLDHVIFGRNEPALHHYHQHYREALDMPPLERFDGTK